MKIIGRSKESDQIKKALKLGRNLLVEGPVGVGKTFLIQNLLKDAKKNLLESMGIPATPSRNSLGGSILQ